MPSTKQLLLEHTYPGDLAGDIEAMRAEGLSWRAIAGTISDRAGLTITHETLRLWYGERAGSAA